MKKVKYSSRYKKSNSRKRKFGETKPNFNQMIKDACRRRKITVEKEVRETKPNLDLKPKIKLKEIKKEKVKSNHEIEIERYKKKEILKEQRRLKRSEKNIINQKLLLLSLLEKILQEVWDLLLILNLLIEED